MDYVGITAAVAATAVKGKITAVTTIIVTVKERSAIALTIVTTSTATAQTTALVTAIITVTTKAIAVKYYTKH